MLLVFAVRNIRVNPCGPSLLIAAKRAGDFAAKLIVGDDAVFVRTFIRKLIPLCNLYNWVKATCMSPRSAWAL